MSKLSNLVIINKYLLPMRTGHYMIYNENYAVNSIGWFRRQTPQIPVKSGRLYRNKISTLRRWICLGVYSYTYTHDSHA